jgi:hypothetical protein
MASLSRIAFVLPWFGPWPNWMPLFWESCRWNPDIDWLIYTDQAQPKEAPGNIDFRILNLEEMYRLIAQGLNIELQPPFRAHKLCDFKVATGLIFEDRLRNYDFWGMCDLDMSWGQIRTFYTEDLLSEYDILTSSRRAINGQCTLFRNIPRVNRFFLTEANAIDILRDKKSRNFSELGIDAVAVTAEKEGKLKTLRRRLHVSETWNDWEEKAEQLEFEERGTLAHFPRLVGPCRWEEGRVFHVASGNEMVFCHYLWAKEIYEERARSYPFWSASMIGWDMNGRDIVMHFKPGHRLARCFHYLTTRLGCVPRHHVMKFVRRAAGFLKNRARRLRGRFKLA